MSMNFGCVWCVVFGVCAAYCCCVCLCCCFVSLMPDLCFVIVHMMRGVRCVFVCWFICVMLCGCVFARVCCVFVFVMCIGVMRSVGFVYMCVIVMCVVACCNWCCCVVFRRILCLCM